MTNLKNLKGIKIYDRAEDVPLGLDAYKAAADLGMNFWQYLEVVNPSKPTDNLNAFERQLKLAGIITKSQPERGLFSSPGEYFFQSDRPGSAVLFPTLLQKTALWNKLNRVTDINKLVATTRTISGTSAFQTLSIDDSELTSGRRFRVDQRGNFPVVKVGWSEKTQAVTKHGVQLNWTYEFVRRSSIELMQTVVARLTLQDQQQIINDAVDMAINGDGGPNPACRVMNFAKSTATPGVDEIQLNAENDSIAAGVLPYEGYLKFIGGMKPYQPNVVCGSLNTLVKFATMARPNMDPAEIVTKLIESKSQGTAKFETSVFPNVELVLIDSMPENRILAVDTSFALERVIELGSDIKEVEKVIQNQTEAMVISIADTASKIFPEAVRLLNFSAVPTT